MSWSSKKSSPSSFRTSMITRVFPVSWFSRFKNKSGGFQGKAPVSKQGTCGIKNLWYDTDRDHNHRYGSREIWNFDKLVFDMKKMKEEQNREAELEGPDDSEKEIHVVESHITSNPSSIEKDYGSEPMNFETRSGKVKSICETYYPETGCKIQAVEEMRKAKMKLKSKLLDEQVIDGRTIYDSFAVVKSSISPEEDFRDSMVEMISERGIGLPEELEELLACYLTMNAKEYHNIIIEVFKQIWLELYGIADHPETQNNQNFQHYKILQSNVSQWLIS